MLEVSETVVNQIVRDAESAYPNECCGIIFGKREDSRRVCCKARRMENKCSDAAHFSISPLDVLQAEIAAQSEGLEPVGFYHSHPDCGAVLSDEDKRYMIDNYSYPVISVKGGKAAEIACFDSNGREFIKIRA